MASLENIVVETAAQNGLGLYYGGDEIIHCTVEQAGASCYITESTFSDALLAYNRAWGAGADYCYSVGNVRMLANSVAADADVENYNYSGFNPTWVNAHAYAFSQPGELTTGVGTFRLPFSTYARILHVKASVAVAPTGSTLIVDVNKNGTTIFPTATKPTIGISSNLSSTGYPDVTKLTPADYLTVDIDQVGSTIAGEDLVVSVEVEFDRLP